MPRAFDPAATSQDVTYTKTVRPVKVVFEENEADAGAPVTIKVDLIVDKDGERRRVTRRVPQAVVNDNWPGPQMTLENYLLTLIDLAE